MKPESVFRTVLWFLGPFLAWFIGKIVIRRIESWHAARSESTARASLAYYRLMLENPPTLLESTAYLVCFLPLPIFLAALFVCIYFAPWRGHHMQIDPELGEFIRRETIAVLGFIIYLVFGVLVVHGVKTAYHLRHGEAMYVHNYRLGVLKRMDKLKKKFPQLDNEQERRTSAN